MLQPGHCRDCLDARIKTRGYTCQFGPSGRIRAQCSRGISNNTENAASYRQRRRSLAGREPSPSPLKTTQPGSYEWKSPNSRQRTSCFHNSVLGHISHVHSPELADYPMMILPDANSELRKGFETLDCRTRLKLWALGQDSSRRWCWRPQYVSPILAQEETLGLSRLAAGMVP